MQTARRETVYPPPSLPLLGAYESGMLTRHGAKVGPSSEVHNTAKAAFAPSKESSPGRNTALHNTPGVGQY